MAEFLLLSVPELNIPGLLLSAALIFRALEVVDYPIARFLPDMDSYPGDGRFREAVRSALSEDREALLRLMRRHTYQCNPPRRMAVSLVAMAAATQEWDCRPALHVDVGTASGIGLLLGQARAETKMGNLGLPNASLAFPLEMRGSPPDLGKWKCAKIENSVGIDLDPPDLHDAGCRAWMRACQFPMAAEWGYFDRAVELFRSQSFRIERGPATDLLPRLSETLPKEQPLVVTDTYVTVFMSEEEREELRRELDTIAQSRPMVWISNNPVVPLGGSPDRTTAGTPLPRELVERNHRELFGTVCATTWPGGKRTPRLLGVTHPGGCWLEWRPDFSA
jgi:hypothetical protein